MANISTIRLLYAWAKWGIGHHIDYPSMSPMFGERALKSPLYESGHAPADVLVVEKAVCELDFEFRDALIQRYQRRLTWKQMGERIGTTWRTAQRRTQQAEVAVHHKITKSPCVM